MKIKWLIQPFSFIMTVMRNRLYTAVILLLLAIFISSSFYILNYFFNSNRESKQYTKLKNQITEQTEEIPVNQYQSLYDINNDLVGWLTINNTRIDYPVVKSQEDNYYLKHNFYKEYSDFGCPYIQGDIDADNIIIYGHNMDDGSMFSDLTKYKSEDFFLNNQYISFNTLYDNRTYQIISVFKESVDLQENNVFFYNRYSCFESEEQFNEFISNINRLSLYSIKTEAQYGDSLLTLSTCEYSYNDGRIVVVAKLVDCN